MKAREIRVHRAGIDLAVYERGNIRNPTVVLIHGYPDTHAVWDAVADRLADRFHVVSYDVRGAGASGVPSTPAGYDMTELIADLDAVIATVSPRRGVHLAAHDWGSIQTWAALTRGPRSSEVLSYTSISGPDLDHVSRWMREHRSWRPSRLRALLAQVAHSWYVALFQVPRAPDFAWRHLVAKRFTADLRVREGISAPGHPAPTLAADGANGLNLYRQNMGRAASAGPRRVPGSTSVPVQLIVPRHDRFVTPALLDGIEASAPNLIRVDIDAGHWVVVADPDRIAGLIDEHVRRNLPV